MCWSVQHPHYICCAQCSVKCFTWAVLPSQSWNSEAAANAQAWVNKCTGGHSDSKDREISSKDIMLLPRVSFGKKKREKKVNWPMSFLCCCCLPEASGCGENWAGATAKVSWSTIIQDWYSEVNDWRYGVGSINGNAVGHFTQVCFDGPSHLSYHTNTNIVCWLYVL